MTASCKASDPVHESLTHGDSKEREMKKMPSRDTNGKCIGACRDRVKEGELRRHKQIASEPYSAPVPNWPSWARDRNDTPGALDGHGL